MSTFVYKSASGKKTEAEYPIGQAPPSITVGKVIYERYYGSGTEPVIRPLTSLERGDRPSIAHSLPTYYGYGQRETVWKEHMQKLDLEDTSHRRRQLVQAGMVPSPKYIERRSREAAAKAGALDRFDKIGRPIARNKREVSRVIDTAKKKGDVVAWD